MDFDYNTIAKEVDEIRKTWIQGDYEKAHKMIERRTKDEFSVEFELEKLLILMFTGELTKVDILLNDLIMSHNLGKIKSREFISNIIQISLYFFKGHITKMKPIIEKTETYLEEIKVDDYLYFWKALFFLMKGIYYFTDQQFELGLQFYSDAEKLVDQYQQKYYSSKLLLATVYNNNGEMYRNLGKLEDSLKYLEKSRGMVIENNISFLRGEVYSQLGATYSELGESEKAINYYEDSLKDQILLNMPMYLSLFNFRLFYLYLLSDNVKKANELQQRIHELSEENPDEIFYQQTDNLMKAILMMRQNRRKSKTQAQIIIEDLINNKNLWLDYQNISKILLIQLLLEEYADFEEDEILDEATILMEQLKNQAEENNNHLLMGELAILKSKISLVTKNINKANDILQEAKKNAETKNFVLLQNKIDDEMQQLEQLVIEWQEFASIESTIKQRLEKVNIQRYLQKMIREYK